MSMTIADVSTVIDYDKDLKFDYRHGSLGQAHNGDLLIMDWVSERSDWALRKTGRPDFVATRLSRSTDMGKTWSKPRDLKLRDKLGHGVSGSR